LNKKDIGEYGADSLREQYVIMSLNFMKLLDDEDTHKLLFSQIIVNGASNGRLGANFGLTPTSRGPVFGFIKAGTDEILPYDGSFDKYALVAFLNLHTDVKIFIPGTLPEFAPLVTEFVMTAIKYPSVEVVVEVEVTDEENTTDSESDSKSVSEAPINTIRPEYIVSDEIAVVMAKAQAMFDTFEAGSDSAVIGDHYLKVRYIQLYNYITVYS